MIDTILRWCVRHAWRRRFASKSNADLAQRLIDILDQTHIQQDDPRYPARAAEATALAEELRRRGALT